MQLGLYQHYKGNVYQVIGIARHSETLEEMVVYQALYRDFGIWARPKEMFKGTVEYEGKIVPRFTYLRAHLESAPVVHDR
jgi:hypothetical protein